MESDFRKTSTISWYDRKSEQMSHLLGKEYDRVMHAVTPYELGGGLDLFYYTNKYPGTAVATKELSKAPDYGPSNSVFETYELAMFTRENLAVPEAMQHDTNVGTIHHSINAILNCIARYSAEAILNPNETCEFPTGMKIVGGRCLIFDAFNLVDTHAEFGLLAIIEIHRSELNFARSYGGGELIALLRKSNYYPYSDLDRPAVA